MAPSLQLNGIGASPGTATGQYFVAEALADLDDFEEGGILVVRQSNPAWIAGFLAAAGVVAEHGGLISHAAIAARELGLPCVVGVERATALIETGQSGRVDGTTGVVAVDG